MPIMLMDKNKMVWCCMCGKRSTYNFDFAGVSTKTGPFSLALNDTLSIKFNDTNGGTAVIENIIFVENDFPNFNDISADLLATKLNSVLVNGKAVNDYGSVLIESKINGNMSCVEVIDGSARSRLGFDMRDKEVIRHCCERICIGYKQNDVEYRDVIILRPCSNCSAQSSIIRNHVNYSKSDSEKTQVIHRRAVNSLALYFQNKGFVDNDLVNYYQNNPYSPPESLTEYPNQAVQLFDYEKNFTKK